MAAYTETKTYHTKAHMGMIDVTEDFRHAVEEAARQKNIRNGTITGFTTGGVAALTTLEFEPGLVGHDLKAALDAVGQASGNIVLILIEPLLFKQSHSLLAHALFLCAVQVQGGGEEVLLCAHVLCDDDVLENAEL